MSYQASWGSSFYDSSYRTEAETWRANLRAAENPHAASEQYNPVYPSYNSTSSTFFSSSPQTHYDAPPYYPSKTSASSTTVRGSTRKPASRGVWNKQSVSKKPLPKSNFHLITVNTDSAATSKLPENVAAKIGEATPKPTVKVARANNKSAGQPRRGRAGVQKMPNYRGLSGNGWEANGYQGGRPSAHGGRGRGGGQRGGRSFRAPLKPTNSKDDIPFVNLPEDQPAINLPVNPEKVVAFHGFDSVFTTQHNFPVLIDNKVYTSCDHYYQIRKLLDLTGASSDRLDRTVRDEHGKLLVEPSQEKEKKAYSSIAKEIIKAAKVEKEKTNEWRVTKGLEAVQKAMYAKATQSAHLRAALKESGDSILVHSFPLDSIYGTGCTVPQIRKWLDDLAKSGVQSLRIPATFPLNETTVQHCPTFAQGRNILGVILMQLREKIRKDEIEIVDMTGIYESLRNDSGTAEPMDTSTKTSEFISDKKTIGTF